jgi:glycosyltransferase involved in cell wall biosynthesis
LKSKEIPRLAIITTHPIQYYAPVFRLLQQRGAVHPKVFYTWEQAQYPQYDPGFGKTVEWDIPLLEGYDYIFTRNTARQPGSSHFWGIVNPELIQQINSWAPDAILIFGWSYWGHLQVIRYFKGKIPVYFRGDSHLLNEQKGFKQLFRRNWLKWVYRHVDFAFYVGTNNKAYFEVHGLKEGQLRWAPHAIDNLRFQQDYPAQSQQALAWRRSLGIPNEALVFLFVGKFDAVKNPQLFLDAFLKSGLENAHLIFVGNGTLEQEVKERAKENAHIHFLPFQNQSQMPIIYRLGQVYVLCSKSETWGLAVNEAMACGLPVVVSNKVGCAIDLVVPGENGYIFESGNVSALVEVLQRIAENYTKSSLDLMGQASLSKINSWSFDVLCDQIEESILKS